VRAAAVASVACSWFLAFWLAGHVHHWAGGWVGASIITALGYTLADLVCMRRLLRGVAAPTPLPGDPDRW
jgi:hypothetical protein